MSLPNFETLFESSLGYTEFGTQDAQSDKKTAACNSKKLQVL